MPDKKLTDNLSNNSPILSNSLSDAEVVKVIEFCSNFGDCKYCQITLPDGIRKGTNGCYSFLLKLALNVISNKESEKEKMRYQLADTVVRCAAQEQKIKAEAYKECTKKLKSIFGEWIYDYKTDNFFKELEGDNNAGN